MLNQKHQTYDNEKGTLIMFYCKCMMKNALMKNALLKIPGEKYLANFIQQIIQQYSSKLFQNVIYI